MGISRRTAFAAALAVATTAAATGIGPAPTSSAAPEDRPNVVLILLDDLDATTTPFWDAMPETAQRLRDQGVTFTSAYVPSPNCCPARAGILTGQYGHNNGVLTNLGPGGGWTGFHPHESSTLATRLDDAGYSTALFGKYLNGYDLSTTIPPGWDRWWAGADVGMYAGYDYRVNDQGTLVHYDKEPADYFTDVLAAKVVDYLDSTEATDADPFFAYVAPTAPHLPLRPAARHETSHPFIGATTPHSPNYAEADVTDKPWWLRISAVFRTPRLVAVDADYRKRLATLMSVDDMVAAIHDRLAANGELDHTYFVFASDNGYNLGAHGLVDKLVPYEESSRIPLVIAGPGIEPGGTRPQLALTIDLAPTILDWAGLAIPADIDGRSLRDAIAASATPLRASFLLEYRTSASSLDPETRWISGILFDAPSYRAVHTDRWVLIEWDLDDHLGSGVQFELYDLSVDPYQLENLAAPPAGITAHLGPFIVLRNRLEVLSSCTGATC